MRDPANSLTKKAPYKGLGADSEEKHEPVSDIDTAVVDSLKVLDLKRPIREADILRVVFDVRFVPVANMAHHSIISAARSRIDVGTSMPSAFAVFKLMEMSNFVGSSTGRSAASRP